MFAAVSSVEPVIVQRETVRYSEGDKSWAGERMAMVEARLAEAPWLDGAFSAGDLMMVSVLLRLKSSGILDVGG